MVDVRIVRVPGDVSASESGYLDGIFGASGGSPVVSSPAAGGPVGATFSTLTWEKERIPNRNSSTTSGDPMTFCSVPASPER